MKAVVIRQHGGPEALQYEDANYREPGPGEILLEVRAASINHIDIWVRKGLPGVRFDLPRIPGCDAAGIVRRAGEGVEDLAEGARVVINPAITCGRCEYCAAGAGSQCTNFAIVGEHRDGTYAQLVTIPAHLAIPLPDSITFEEAAAAPLVFLTAWSMLIVKGNIRPGEDVLILGAGAGVGTAALQIAKMIGCRVFATCSTDEKLDRARQSGADFLINHTKDEFDRKVREITERRGVDVVVDYIGGDSWVRSLRSARKGGRILTCGATAGYAPQTDLRHIFYRQLQVIGSTMGSPKEFLDVMRCIFRGQLKPVVDRVLPLSQAADGHSALESREVFGKIVLQPWAEGA